MWAHSDNFYFHFFKGRTKEKNSMYSFGLFKFAICLLAERSGEIPNQDQGQNGTYFPLLLWCDLVLLGHEFFDKFFDLLTIVSFRIGVPTILLFGVFLFYASSVIKTGSYIGSIGTLHWSQKKATPRSSTMNQNHPNSWVTSAMV